jgi:DNA-binding response OmpR family regulator
VEDKIKVLVIEDEELLLEAIARKLTNEGLEPITCTGAAQAFDYLNSLPTPPDIIWLDYYLKDTNGLEFMQRLRKDEKWSTLPVVVVSNSASEEKKKAMLALGVKKYLLKAEYRLEEIIKIIKEMVQTK